MPDGTPATEDRCTAASCQGSPASIPQSLHHLPAHDAVDALFAWAGQMGQAMQEASKAKQARQAQERRRRARVRYAASKAGGLSARRVQAAAPRELGMEAASSCACSTCRMPPCQWCENGGWDK